MTHHKKTAAFAALALTSVIGLTACGGRDADTPAGPPETVGASGASVATSENTTASNAAESPESTSPGAPAADATPPETPSATPSSGEMR